MNSNSQRKVYIDILRCILIIFVVIWHVDIFVLDTEEINLRTNAILLEVRMPLFFFISGYLVHSFNYGPAIFANRLANRILCQFYPTIVIFIVYNLVTGVPILDALGLGLKNGYWFTYIVFLHFCVYSAIILLLSIANTSRRGIQIILACLVISSLCYLKPLHHTCIPNGSIISNYLSAYQFFIYLPYFFFGAFTKSISDAIMRYCNPFVTIVLLSISIIFTYYLKDITVCYYVGKIGLTLSIFLIFAHLAKYISYNGAIKSHMSTIGRSTLQIYLLHYFFIYFLSELSIIEVLTPFITSNKVIFLFAIITLSLACVYGSLALHKLLEKIGLAKYIFPPRNLYLKLSEKRNLTETVVKS